MQTTPDAPAIAGVLVNWNNWQDTADCLAALRLQDYPHLQVLVVDNGSTNDSLARLRALHPWATYLESTENLGFPKACNLAARHPLAADAPFLWFLNNDTLAPPDTATKLLRKAQAEPRTGILGAVLYYMHDPTSVQAWGGGGISRWTGYNSHFRAPSAFGPTGYITFASAFVRRETFDQLHGLYEGAFMYFEDADFSLRAQAAGWQLAVAPDTAILHKEGGAETGPAANPQKLRGTTFAGLLFLSRHCPAPAVGRILFLLSRLAKRAVAFDLTSIRAILAGARDFRLSR